MANENKQNKACERCVWSLYNITGLSSCAFAKCVRTIILINKAEGKKGNNGERVGKEVLQF